MRFQHNVQGGGLFRFPKMIKFLDKWIHSMMAIVLIMNQIRSWTENSVSRACLLSTIFSSFFCLLFIAISIIVRSITYQLHGQIEKFFHNLTISPIGDHLKQTECCNTNSTCIRWWKFTNTINYSILFQFMSQFDLFNYSFTDVPSWVPQKPALIK